MPAAHGILVPQPGIESASPTLVGGFLTTGPPRKSVKYLLKFFFLNLATLGLHFGTWVFPMAHGILVPQPGIKPTSPALEGGFLTTGPPEKFPLNIS